MTNLHVYAPTTDYKLDPRLEHFRDCTRCKLGPHANESCKQVVMPVGSLQAEILWIFENAGWVENEIGWTVSGPSYPPSIGAMVKRYGFDELTQFMRTNVNMCLPLKSQKPTKAQMKQCRVHLDYLIDHMPNLKLIIPVGRIALQAIEGEDAVLNLRVGRPGRREYIYANGLSSGKKYFTIPLIHPAHDLRIENDRGRIRAANEYNTHLRFIRDFYDHIDDIENFVAPYKYHICWTVEENLYWANFIATNPNIKHVVIDFETSEIIAPGWAKIICMAVSFQLTNDEGIDEIHAVVFVFNQCVETVTSRDVKRKKSKSVFEHKWELVPWFEDYPTLEQEIAEMFRPKLQGDENSFFVSGWNMAFDSMCSFMNWGYRFVPRPEQVPKCGVPVDPEVPPRDIMLMYRFLNSDLRSLSLKTVLSASMPLISESKDLIESAIEYLHGKSVISETGYMLMAFKPPADMSFNEFQEHGKIYNEWIAECDRIKSRAGKNAKNKKETVHLPPCPLSGRVLQNIEQHWCPNLSEVRAKVLFERAAFDSAVELDLWLRAKNMLLNEEVISIGTPLSDDIWV